MQRRRSNIITCEDLTPEQRHAAKLLASGTSWERTGAQVGVTFQTVGNWLKIPQFVELRNEWQTKIETILEEELVGGSTEMMDLWRRWLRGEISANDKRISTIAPTILRWTERYWSIEPDPPRVGGTTVQILNAPGLNSGSAG